MRALILLCLLGAVPVAAHAELAVCFNTARELGKQFYYYNSISPSQAATDPFCSVVSKASGQTAAQQHLIAQTPDKYLTVAGGLAVEMIAADKEAVDAYLAAKVATAQELQQEANQEGVCKFNSLEHVTTAITTRRDTKEAQLASNRAQLQAAIDAVAAANLAALKDILTQMNTAKYMADHELLLEEYKLSENIMRCVFARARVN